MKSRWSSKHSTFFYWKFQRKIFVKDFLTVQSQKENDILKLYVMNCEQPMEIFKKQLAHV